MNKNLVVGGIYNVNWDKRPMKVLAFDDKELFYDCYCPELKKWTFSGNIRTLTFYRVPTEYFILTSEQIDIVNISEKEYDLFKLNFPFRFCRINDFEILNLDYYLQNLEKINIENNYEIIFKNKIVLLPRTKNNSFLKGEVVEIKSINELLIKTKELQKTAKNLKFNGLGFYRSGLINKLPSYYIGEYIDLAKILVDKI